MNLEKARLKCLCGGWMDRGQTPWKGMLLRSWKCTKCGEVVFHPVDAQIALELRRAQERHALDVRVRRVGTSLILTIPKIISDSVRIREGQRVSWNLRSALERRMEVTVE